MLRAAGRTGTFDGTLFYDTTQSAAQGHVLITDMNGDKRDDMVVTHMTDSSLGVRLGQADGSLGPESPTSHLLPTNLAVGDFNADGIQDLVVVSHGGVRLSALLGGTGPPFEIAFPFGSPNGVDHGAVAAEPVGRRQGSFHISSAVGMVSVTFCPVAVFVVWMSCSPSSGRATRLSLANKPAAAAALEHSMRSISWPV